MTDNNIVGGFFHRNCCFACTLRAIVKFETFVDRRCDITFVEHANNRLKFVRFHFIVNFIQILRICKLEIRVNIRDLILLLAESIDESEIRLKLKFREERNEIFDKLRFINCRRFFQNSRLQEYQY